MLTFVKKDFSLHRWSTYIGIAVFLFLAYFITLPSTFIFVVCLFALFLPVFYDDAEHKVNRYFISTPVKKEVILTSRYLFSVLIILMILVMQLGIMVLLEPLKGGTLYIYNWKDIFVLFCIGCTIIAISIPIITLFNSINLSFGIILALFGAGNTLLIIELFNVLHMEDEILLNDLDGGFILLVEKYLPFQPYIMLGIITAIILLASWFVTLKLFNRK
ncbi:ABC-2 transporter permease [Pseudogracilibacillus sp. SE30717A]|uniref:ABC-2 transporter permease n=1 Tax=Pseudogracilibacillus sp. SE30717A TaxID=3098293 RepID=UPI00300E30BE